MRELEKKLFKVARILLIGDKADAIPLLEAAATSMGSLGQCHCCCGIDPSASSHIGFGGFFGGEVKEPNLRFQPDEIGHDLDCDLALMLYNLGSEVVFKGGFTEEDRLTLLKLKEGE